MMAYANPLNRRDEKQRGDGFGIARFNKTDRTVTFEAWPRFASVKDGDSAQYPGWPITIRQRDNDGRRPVGYLSEIIAPQGTRPVVQVVDEKTKEVLYTTRLASNRFKPPVYSDSVFTIRYGEDQPESVITGQKIVKDNTRPLIQIDPK